MPVDKGTGFGIRKKRHRSPDTMLIQYFKEQISFEPETYFMTAFKILLWNFLLTAGPSMIKKCLRCC